MRFEAVSQFDEEERAVVRALIDSMILKRQAKRLLHAEAKTPKAARGKARLAQERRQ